MTRHSIVIVLSALIANGCKGDTVTKPDPQTQADLDQCRKDKDEKDKRIAALQDENAQLMREKGSGAEIVVSIEGNALTVKPHTGGGAPPIDDKAAAAASKEFLDVVARSRGAIQKCYEQALKKNSGLQAVTVSMKLSASFGASGEFSRMSTTRSLGDTFDGCLHAVAQKWKLPAAPAAMTFQASVSLSPT